MADHLRELLRALPGFPPELPVLDPTDVPDDPMALFREWLDAAIASGARQPHAFDLLTLNAEGAPVGRVLIIKAIDERGIHFSTHASSRKGGQLEDENRASMLFFWRESGRTVRISGVATPLSDEESQRDWEQRPTYDGAPNLDWRVYALDPSEFEFMQAREDRQHVRLEYQREGDGWHHGLVATPAG